MKAPAIAGLILCGGASRRMGSPKALLMLDGQTFADRLIESFRSCSPVVVVLGHESRRIRAGLARELDVICSVNPDPERGMLSSLQTGLMALPPDLDAVIFTPVDYPAIQPSTVQALAHAFASNSAPVIRPLYASERGHPVCVSRALMTELLALPTTAQARDVVRAYRAQTHYVQVNDPGILQDIDYLEDYLHLQASMAAVR